VLLTANILGDIIGAILPNGTKPEGVEGTIQHIAAMNLSSTSAPSETPARPNGTSRNRLLHASLVKRLSADILASVADTL